MNFNHCVTARRNLIYGDINISRREADIYQKKNRLYYSIKQLAYHGDFFYSFDQANEYHQESSIPAILLFIGILVLWNAWFAFTIIVGHHPERFKPWFIKLFFKDGYIKY